MGTIGASLKAPESHHSPELPPADVAAETRAVHAELVSDHTLHGEHRLQAGGTHFCQHGLNKERLSFNNWITTTWNYLQGNLLNLLLALCFLVVLLQISCESSDSCLT